jgi:2-methylcitrate dehydratase PrpD
VTLTAFAPGGLHDPELRAMMGCIEIAIDGVAEAAFPAMRAARVAVTTHDGRVRSHRQPTRRGDPDFPLSDEEIEAKFHGLAVPVIGVAAAAEVAKALWRVDALESVAQIAAPEAARGGG